ncbi:LRR receptor-like serine/threonine-protein kinase FLS2 [Selaginella moellendorffii]|uniref:LRR receptor-like serine/threonine-protein kinase FLS2 n=1 Tax=Selaginella moellendorffii TaxID=88036 RepID=UPI000D1C38CD|nr:LRR receptor-like serine/threonine-protein kinase FLS2 [Selaginella moellendorffii]|eukprot:XP_024530944.1 LRR receptor-like serine/threonine-protein kinase FLS2 [Selaginella moellendorffii]
MAPMLLLFFLCALVHCLRAVTEVEVLLDFKKNIINGASLLPDWNAENSTLFCSWRGVLCDESGAYVTALELPGMNLTGRITNQIGHLSSLKGLDLHENNFFGEIPSSLGNCSKLFYVYLYANHLSGAIPASLAFCDSGPIRHLLLSDNSLEGSIPSSFCNTSSMVIRLSLRSNKMNGNLSCKPQIIRHLDLSHNRFTGSIPDNWTVNYLDLSYNSLSGTIPARYSDAVILDLSNNMLSGEIPAPNNNCFWLQILDLSYNRLTGTFPESLGTCMHLHILNVERNLMAGEISLNFSGLGNLNSLQLSGNQFSGLIPRSFYSFPGRLDSMERSPIDTKYVYCNSGLLLLDLSYNNFSGTFPEIFCTWHCLKVLLLSSNQLSGTIPKCIGNISNARVIDLSSNKFSGELSTTSLINLTAFRSVSNWSIGWYSFLNLGDNSGTEADDFTAYDKPFDFNVNVKGRRSTYQKLSDSFTMFDVSSNLLRGHIPPFDHLQGLMHLNLSFNKFDGQIPRELSGLKSLESLDLSSNALSGSIPPALGEISSLSSFNISHNNLSGRIPSSGNLNTRFVEAAFDGNPLLCGAPLPPCHVPSSSLSPRSPVINVSSSWDQIIAENIAFYAAVATGFSISLSCVLFTRIGVLLENFIRSVLYKSLSIHLRRSRVV